MRSYFWKNWSPPCSSSCSWWRHGRRLPPRPHGRSVRLCCRPEEESPKEEFFGDKKGGRFKIGAGDREHTATEDGKWRRAKRSRCRVETANDRVY